MFWIVVTALILGSEGSLPINFKCGVQPKSRDECGYPGINADDCQSKGCCYDDSISDSIWCYNPWQLEESICNPENPKARVNCGYPGISEKDCSAKGCCFDSQVPQVPWCYQGAVQAVERDCVAVDPHKRVNCGPPGVSPEQCKENGCCFDSSIPGVKWCFKPEIKKETIQCAVHTKSRVNCGQSGIDMDQCFAKGCCFDSSEHDSIWCFYPDITDVSNCDTTKPHSPCEMGYASRIVPFRYATNLSKLLVEEQCAVAPRERTECGFRGITKEDCIQRGCCFDSNIPEVIWCFNIHRSTDLINEGKIKSPMVHLYMSCQQIVKSLRIREGLTGRNERRILMNLNHFD
ncbi:uncharacterized protein RCH25_036908 [Pelodytes ibericus]